LPGLSTSSQFGNFLSSKGGNMIEQREIENWAGGEEINSTLREHAVALHVQCLECGSDFEKEVKRR
jgi:hypothetical protein